MGAETTTASDKAIQGDYTIYEARPTTELSAAAREAAEDGNTEALLTELTKSKNPIHRKVAEALLQMMEVIPRRTKVVVEDNVMTQGRRAEGYFNRLKNRVVLDRAFLSEEATLHEFIHAVTVNVLKTNPSTLSFAQREARKEIEALFEKIKNDPKFSSEYGSINPWEFVSELFTNSNLRKKLDSIDQSLIKRIFNAILRFIGVDPNALSDKTMQTAFNLFQPPSLTVQDNNNAVVMSSIMRGVFPGTAAIPSENVDQNTVDTVNALVGGASDSGDKITASALGLRTKIADRWAPTEELVKLGISKNQVTEAQAMQLRLLMRVSEDVRRLTSMAITDSLPQIVVGADGVKTIQGSGTGVNAKQIAEALSGSKLGNARFVEKLYTSWLAILRAERDGIGYDKLNFGEGVIDAAKAAGVKATVNSDPATKEAFNKARNLYQQYNKGLLKLLVDSGFMDQKKADELLSGDYVPFYRINGGIVELHVGSGKKITIGNVIDQPQLKELIGDKDEILPVFSSMVQNTSILMRAAVRNMQMNDVGNMLQSMGMAKVIKGEGPREQYGKRNVFTARFRSKGVDHYVRLDEAAFPENIPAEVVIMGLQGVKTAIPTMVKMFQIPVDILRKGITRMPTYALRQLARDPIHAWMVTGGDFSAVLDTYKEFFKSLKAPTPTELTLQRSGAISSNVQHLGSQEEVSNMLRDLTSGKSGWGFNGILAKLDMLGMKADAATRSAIYNNYRKKGMSHNEALLGAAEAMNFSRHGTSSSLHWLSSMTPFFNSQIQGLDSVYRAGVKGTATFQDKLDIRAKFIKRGALMAGMTAAYALMMQDDDTYKNATPSERSNSWFIPIPGTDATLRVPIPFEPGLVFKSIPEMFINTAFGDTKARDALDALGKQLVQAQPISIPASAKPIIELAANYNFYADAPIVSLREEKLTTERQFRNNTTELAKLLGKTGAISPLSVDHLIRSYTGGLGMLLVQMGDYAIRPFASPDAADKPTKDISEMPVFGTLFQPADGRGMIESAFKDVKQFQKAATTYQAMLKEGNRSEAAAFANKYARDIAINSVGGSFIQKMGELASLKRQIATMPGMPSDQKQAQIKNIKNLEIQLAQMIRKMSSKS